MTYFLFPQISPRRSVSTAIGMALRCASARAASSLARKRRNAPAAQCSSTSRRMPSTSFGRPPGCRTGPARTGAQGRDRVSWLFLRCQQPDQRLEASMGCSFLTLYCCCPTELTYPIIIGMRRSMPTPSSRARSRTSFPSRPRSTSFWLSTSRPRRSFSLKCRHYSGFPPDSRMMARYLPSRPQ
jgi:hypothetical protein